MAKLLDKDTREVSTDTGRFYFENKQIWYPEHVVELSTLFVDGRPTGVTGRSSWGGRPWQLYRYHKSMVNAVEQYLAKYIGFVTEQVSSLRGWRRLTSKRRAEINDMVKYDQVVLQCSAVLDKLNKA